MDDVSVLASIKEPDAYPVNDSLFLQPAPEGNDVTIVRGPNIKAASRGRSPEDTLTARVSLKARDNVSTDDITPASAEFSSMRSNMPAMAQYAYCRYDPDFAKRAPDHEKELHHWRQQLWTGLEPRTRGHYAHVPWRQDDHYEGLCPHP